MVDIKHLEVTIDSVLGARARTRNPLGTSFDLADVVVSRSGKKLLSSPFLRTWSGATEQAFSRVQGIWLVSTEAEIEMVVGFGRRAVVGAAFGHLDNEALEMSLFFEMPAELAGGTQLSLHLTVICMD